MTDFSRKDIVCFFRTKHPFSQWHPANFIVDDISYNCAEQYMMAQKALLFGDHESYTKIMQSNEPRVHKKIGRGVKGFIQKKWDETCEKIVLDANIAKFSQNEDLLKILLDTEDKLIVEASPYDKIWGIGMAEDDPNILDILAVAYASASRYNEAVTTAEKALELAELIGNEDLARQIRGHLTLFREGQRYIIEKSQ